MPPFAEDQCIINARGPLLAPKDQVSRAQKMLAEEYVRFPLVNVAVRQAPIGRQLC